MCTHNIYKIKAPNAHLIPFDLSAEPLARKLAHIAGDHAFRPEKGIFAASGSTDPLSQDMHGVCLYRPCCTYDP